MNSVGLQKSSAYKSGFGGAGGEPHSPKKRYIFPKYRNSLLIINRKIDFVNTDRRGRKICNSIFLQKAIDKGMNIAYNN